MVLVFFGFFFVITYKLIKRVNKLLSIGFFIGLLFNYKTNTSPFERIISNKGF